MKEMKRILKCIQNYWEDDDEFWTAGKTYAATKHKDGTWSIKTNFGSIGKAGIGYMLGKDEFDEYFEEVKTKKIQTYQFNFINPLTGEEDETQFCAYNRTEAESLFYDFCKDEKLGVIPADKVKVSIVYNEDDAKEYGSEYGRKEPAARSPMSKKRMKELLDQIVEQETVARSGGEAVKHLLYIGFKAEELVEYFNFPLSLVMDAEQDMDEYEED